MHGPCCRHGVIANLGERPYAEQTILRVGKCGKFATKSRQN
jgi:hypothetical protein